MDFNGARGIKRKVSRPATLSRNEGVTRRICLFFYNHPDKAFYPRDLLKLIKKTDELGEYKTLTGDTVRKSIQRLKKRKIIRYLTTERKYTIYMKEVALKYIERRFDYSETPSPPMIQHHKGAFSETIPISSRRLKILEPYLTHPRNNDRAKQRIFATRNISVTIYETVLKAKFYCHGPDWQEDISKYFGKKTLTILQRQEMEIGRAIKLSDFIGFKVVTDDLDVSIDQSQFEEGEVCLHGKEDEVNAAMHNLLMERTSLTSFQGDILEALRTLLLTHKKTNDTIVENLDLNNMLLVSSSKNDKVLYDKLSQLEVKMEALIDSISNLTDTLTTSFNTIQESLKPKPPKLPPLNDDSIMYE